MSFHGTVESTLLSPWAQFLCWYLSGHWFYGRDWLSSEITLCRKLTWLLYGFLLPRLEHCWYRAGLACAGFYEVHRNLYNLFLRGRGGCTGQQLRVWYYCNGLISPCRYIRHCYLAINAMLEPRLDHKVAINWEIKAWRRTEICLLAWATIVIRN